jgi:opacity protein-like surface antigen
MYRSLLLVSAAIGVLLTGPAAAAQPVEDLSGTYAQLMLGSGAAGRTTLSVSNAGSGDEGLDPGFFTAGAVGHMFSNRVSLEGEILYLRNNINTEDLDSALGGRLNASTRTIGGLANAHYAFTPSATYPLVFSVGGGVGYGDTRYELLGGSASKGGFIWQAIGGVAYPTMDGKVTWNLQYRYVRSPEFKDSIDFQGTNYTAKLETATHVVAVGARMKF